MPGGSSDPWSPDHMTRVIAANLLGAALILAGAYQATAAADVRTRLSWLNFAIAGAILAGAANALWLQRARRVVGDERAALLEAIRERLADIGHGGVASPTAALLAHGVVITGADVVHRPGCPLTENRRIEPRDRDRWAGLRPCDICRP